MKIFQIFGAVVAVHLLAFIFIFASPGCQSGPSVMPTPDATVPTASAPVSFNTAAPQPVDLGTSSASYNPPPAAGHATPTRPGSAAAAAITPASPVENVAPVSTYTVERGDSLWSIAKKNGMTVAELARTNNIPTSTVLKPGRKLIVPARSSAAKEPATVPSAAMSLPAEKTAVRPANGESVKHTVQVGESLGVIARRFQVTVGELAAANNITDPSKVRAGQQLVIPGGRGVASKSPAAPVARPVTTPAAPAAPATNEPAAPVFEIAPPPPGQDLDAGLKPGDTEVPTIRVEESAPTAN
ncbi:MAG TPA: LysM peptidoglycan-binding domain-containing protein [Lacunisphaera sp.]|nr:LysM peptidoglycan-binding domain-containing protein [Lacunisphaera sp.]